MNPASTDLLQGSNDHTLAPIEHPVTIAHRRKRRWLVYGASAAAGTVAEQLLRADGSFVPAPYLLAIIVGLTAVIRHRRGAVPLQSRILLAASACFALLSLLRDSPLLVFANVVTSMGLAAIAAAPHALIGVYRVWSTTISESARLLANVFAFVLLGPIRTGVHRHEKLFERGSNYAVGLSVLRSATFALAAMAFIGMLLAVGDPVFASATASFTNIDIPAFVSHSVVAAQFAWPAAGILMAASGLSSTSVRLPEPPLPTLNRLDVVTVLGGLNLLFGAFILLQVRALFGGAAYVHDVTGLTLAEYARSGFFTLVAVAALTIGILLALDAHFGRETLAEWKPARRLSQLMVAFVALVMASAATRMSLYIASFGLSIDRLYAFAAIAWLSCVCAWFWATVLVGRARQFIVGVLSSGLATLAVLTLLGPEQLVVRENLARANRGQVVDVAYLANALSADAVPQLVSAIADHRVRPLPDSTAGANDCLPIASMLGRWSEKPYTEWNLARRTARRAVHQNRDALQAVSCSRTGTTRE